MRVEGIVAGVALSLAATLAPAVACQLGALRGTGDLALVVERAAGRVQVVDTTAHESLCTVAGLGDLSHASAVFSRDDRFAFVFGRDGGLSKIDLLTGAVVRRIVQAGNSIGGAISSSGRLVAAANYDPGGIRVFDSGTLEPVLDLPATGADGHRSKVVGVVDAPGERFAFALYDAGEIWSVDLSDPARPEVQKFANAGLQPYDGLITPDGRYYVAGLFGEDGLSLLDLWHPEQGLRRILEGYGRGEEPLPVYKMPHLEGWAATADLLFLPAVGRHELLIVDRGRFAEVGRVAVHGQPVFAVARPDGREVWVNFAHPDNDVVQVIDVPSRQVVAELTPGQAVLHLEFTPRGDEVWISARDSNRVVVYDTETKQPVAELPAATPSGIFMAARAHRIGL